MTTRNIRFTSVMIGLIGLTSVESRAQSNWVSKTRMPTARSLVVAAAVEGKIYCVGGGPRSGPIYSAVEQYDPATDTWTQRAKIPSPTSGFDVGTVNGKIYVIGGATSSSPPLPLVQEYDPSSDTWQATAPMPTPRVMFSCAVVDGKIYAIGGGTGSAFAASLAVEAYDPAADIWTQKKNLPAPRAGASCSTVNGVVYLVGGVITGGGQSLSTVLAYDPVADTWTTKASMRTPRAHFSTCVLNGKIYAIGGCSGTPYDGSEVVSVEAYDPDKNTWWRMPSMQVKRKALATAAVNGKIYAIGGISQAGWEPGLSTVEEYDPKPMVSVVRVGSILKVSWNGILQSSESVDGSEWQDLNPPIYPLIVPLAGPMKFYRAREP